MLKEYPKFDKFLLIEACFHNNVERVRSQLELAPQDLNFYLWQGRPLFFLTPKASQKNKSQAIVELFLDWIKENGREINFFFPDSERLGSHSVNLIQELYERKCPIEQLKTALTLINKDFFNMQINKVNVLIFLNDLDGSLEPGINNEKGNKYTLDFMSALLTDDLLQNQAVADILADALYPATEEVESEEFEDSETESSETPETDTIYSGLRYIRHYIDTNEALNETLSFKSILHYLFLFSEKPLSHFLSPQLHTRLEKIYKEDIKALKEQWYSNEVEVPLAEQSVPSARVSQTGMYALGKRSQPQEEWDSPAPKKAKNDGEELTFTKPSSPS